MNCLLFMRHFHLPFYQSFDEIRMFDKYSVLVSREAFSFVTDFLRGCQMESDSVLYKRQLLVVASLCVVLIENNHNCFL